MRALLAAALLCAPPVLGQDSGELPDVGVDEKLGATALMDAQLVDEDGKPVRFGDLVDRPTILTLNYFRCAGICTPQLAGVVDLLSEIRLKPGEDFNVLTVSFDERDNAEIAATKRKNYLKQIRRPMTPDGWRFLTGKAADTKALADSTGYEFRPYNEDFVHPAVLIVLSPKGKITRYIYGLTYLPFDVQMAVGEASKGLVRPSVSKVLRFCYTYDPESRTYVFKLTRVVGAVMLILAAGFVGFLIRSGRKKEDDKRA